MGTIVLLDLMGGVALLLWGLHMVQSGILRAFGPELRRFLAKTLQNRMAAFAAWIGAHGVAPKSSTAAGLMATSFVSEGVVALVPALAIMLGTGLGTTLIVQIYRSTFQRPLRFYSFLASSLSGAADAAASRIWVALQWASGSTPLALHILLDTLAPAESAPSVRALLRMITGDPILSRADRLRVDVGCTFKRSDCVAHHVARVFALRHACRCPGVGAWRKSRQRHQSGPKAAAEGILRAIGCQWGIFSTGWWACALRCRFFKNTLSTRPNALSRIWRD